MATRSLLPFKAHGFDYKCTRELGLVVVSRMRSIWAHHRHRGLHHPTSKRVRQVLRAMSVEAERRSKLEGWADKFEKVRDLLSFRGCSMFTASY